MKKKTENVKTEKYTFNTKQLISRTLTLDLDYQVGTAMF